MATGKPIPAEDVYQLPITGWGNGRRRVIVAHALVRNDLFTMSNIVPFSWSCDGKYPTRCVCPAGGCKRKLYLHRLVFEYYHGAVPSGMEIDHIDGNKMNSLPSNLRAITHSANMANMRRKRSGFRGVLAYPNGKWYAQVMVNGKHLHLGIHPTARLAADAVNEAYRVYFPGIQIPNP